MVLMKNSGRKWLGLQPASTASIGARAMGPANIAAHSQCQILLDPRTAQIPALRFATIASKPRRAKRCSTLFEPRAVHDEQIFS
jgi:hypothetical protein